MSKLPVSLGEEGLTEQHLDSILEILQKGREEDYAKIPENLFSNYFLKALAGLEDSPEKIELFYRGAGGYNQPVNVVDTQGNILFQVPALASTSQINPLPENDTAPTFTSIMNAAELLKHRSPLQAKEYMKGFLYKRLVDAHKKGHKSSSLEEQWKKIFERYGIYDQVMQTLDQPITQESQNTPSTNGLELEDEF